MPYKLRVDMEDWNGNVAYAVYQYVTKLGFKDVQ